MAYDDQRGRTGDFSSYLTTPNGQGGGQPNFWTSPPAPTGFLGGEAGGFLQGGGAGGGFTNFSQYLYANPGGAGTDDGTSRTAGQTAVDKAMNGAYGITPPPPAATGGGGSTGPAGGGSGNATGGTTGPGWSGTGGPGWGSGWTPGGNGFGGSTPPANPPPASTPPPVNPPPTHPFSKRLMF